MGKSEQPLVILPGMKLLERIGAKDKEGFTAPVSRQDPEGVDRIGRSLRMDLQVGNLEARIALTGLLRHF
jgi:hypothetical protein